MHWPCNAEDKILSPILQGRAENGLQVAFGEDWTPELHCTAWIYVSALTAPIVRDVALEGKLGILSR